MRNFQVIFAGCLAIFGFIVIVWFIIRGFFFEEFISFKSEVSLINSAQFGDFIGGFVGAIFTLSGILLLYENLSIQREEFTESRKVFLMQQFDNGFYELLNLYKENVNELKCTVGGVDYSGKDFFDQKKNELSNQFTTTRALSKNRRNATLDFQNVYVSHENSLSIYFRTLYRIYNIIDGSQLEEDEKQMYSKILRAQLSYNEMFFIRYNAMTVQGRMSSEFINKYNILKHLSNFDLLEFKDWWSKLNDFEKNGLGTIFKELKTGLIEALELGEDFGLSRDFKSGKYSITIHSVNPSDVAIFFEKDNSKQTNRIDESEGFDRLTIDEIENLIKCILKEIVVVSNFNEYNERRELEFYGDKSINGSITELAIGVRNIEGKPLLV